jgi:hypothetical protein
VTLPARPSRNSGRAKATRFCGPHEQWVRGFACSGCGQLPGDKSNPIQAAHVRLGTGGGTSLKPSSRWVVSLCVKCHIHTQHAKGERTFWARVGRDPKALAEEFARKSRHWPALREMP